MKTRKILAILLSLVMVIGLMTPAAMATEETQTNEATATEVASYDALVAAVANGGEIKLTEDIPVTEMIKVEASNPVILDLNGHTMTAQNLNSNSNFVLWVTVGDTVTINDSVGTGGIANSTTYGYAILNQGTLTVNGGSFTGDTALWNGYDTINATATLNGGTFNFNGAEDAGYSVGNAGTLTINSGVVVNDWLDSFGALTVNGGTIANIYVSTGRATVATAATTISGGTVTGALEIEEDVAETATISGGIFSTDPSDYLADGFVATESNGTWTITDNRVAAIGTTKYATLAEAVEAAQSGDIITIIAEGTYTLPTLTKNLTFKGAEGTEKENIIINLGNTIHTGASFSASVAFEGLTLVRPADAGFVGFQHSTSETYTDCIIKGQYRTYGATVAFTGCAFENTGNNYNIWTYGAKNVTFENCTFDSEYSKAILVYNESDTFATTVAVNNCSFEATTAGYAGGFPDVACAAVEIATNESPDGNYIVNVIDSTFTGPFGGIVRHKNGSNASGNVKYTITFDANGGTCGTETVFATTAIIDNSAITGGKLAELPTPTRSGYTFNGWFTEATGGTKVTIDTVFSAADTLYAQWTAVSTGGSGSSSSGSSSSNTTTSTEKNPDGSTTTTTTNKTTGTVTETTKNTDGSSTTVETKKDGTVTTTEKTAEGVTSTVVENEDGDVTEVTATVPTAAANTAAKNDEPVTLPVEVEAVTDSDDAVEISVNVPSKGATVEIPVEDVTPGTVVVIVDEDGNETIVPTSTISEDGVVVTLEGDATIKVIDNSKDFVDVPEDYTLADSIDFVSARGLFEGTTETTYNPHANTTVAQTATVLARLSGEDFYGAGATQKGAEWAVENGLTDGTEDVSAPITRQQMVLMMWRLAGMPMSDHEIDHHTDDHHIDDHALVAMQWAVEHGILTGYEDGSLKPHAPASRAHVAAFTERYVNTIA